VVDRCMVIQIKVCQWFVCIVSADSPHSSNEDHVKLEMKKVFTLWCVDFYVRA
jgi:hypothetical protein